MASANGQFERMGAGLEGSCWEVVTQAGHSCLREGSHARGHLAGKSS